MDAQATPDMKALMEAFLREAQKAQASTPAPAQGGWGGPAAPAAASSTLPPILGVAVALKVQTPAGRARVYLSLPADVAASYDSLMGAIKALCDAGFPLDLWQDRNSWGQGGGFRGGYQGGYRNGNGYQQNQGGGWGRRGW